MQHKHYDIFKRTVEKLPEINEIIRNKSLTPEQKFREHWIKTFGIDTVEMIERANKKWAETHPEEQHTTPDYSDDDVIPPLTAEEKQAAVTEAIRVMMGRGSADDDDNNALPTKPYKGIAHHPDTNDQTFPL